MQKSQYQLKLSPSFPSSVYSLWSGKLKSPTEWQASWSRCAFHMVNSFRWAQYCAAIIQHLLHGMEKMHCHRVALKKPLRESQGLTKPLRLWPWHKLVGGGQATCILVGHWSCEATGQKMKYRRTRPQRQRPLSSGWRLYKRVNTLHNFSGARKSPVNVSTLSAAAQWVRKLQWALELGQTGMRHCRQRWKIPLIP